MKKYFIVLLYLILISLFISIESRDVLALQSPDYILVEKNKRLMSLYKKGSLIKQYNIALGFSPVGHKKVEGDGKTPEGKYNIISKNPKSSYHLSLKISYPSAEDKMLSKSINVNPGGDIMIHGMKNGFGWIGKYHTIFDWTRGCIAVSNIEIDEIYQLVELGTVIEIKP